MAKKGRFLSNLVALGIGTACSKLAVFFLMPLYTAALTPANFGTVDILINTAALLLPAVSLHVPETVFRFSAGGEEEEKVVAVGQWLLRRGGLILVLTFPFLAISEALQPYLLHLIAYVAAAVLHSYYSHILRGRGQYGFFAVQQIFCTLTTIALAFLFLQVMRLGVGGYLLAVALADVATAVILHFYLHPTASKEATGELRRAMIRYGLPLIPTAMLWWVISALDRYFLLWFHGSDVTGLYAAAYKLPALMTFAAGIFLEGWHYAALHTREEQRRAVFDRIYGALLPVLILFALGLILGGGLLVDLLFASDFHEAAVLVPFLAIAMLFSALSSFLGSVYVVKLRSGATLRTAALGAAVHTVACALLIPPLGAAGAVAATVFSYFAVFLRRAADCRRLMPFAQHAGKLALSVLALLGIAALTAGSHLYLAFFCAPLAVAPFWSEMRCIFRLLCAYFAKMRQTFLTKRQGNTIMKK